MSIYDDLANSDYADPGKFREQLKQLGQLKESQETDQDGEHAALSEADDKNQCHNL